MAIIAYLWRRNIVLFPAKWPGLVSVRVTHCTNECQTSQRVSDPDRNGENFDKSVTGGAAELRARWEKSINNERERSSDSSDVNPVRDVRHV